MNGKIVEKKVVKVRGRSDGKHGMYKQKMGLGVMVKRDE